MHSTTSRVVSIRIIIQQTLNLSTNTYVVVNWTAQKYIVYSSIGAGAWVVSPAARHVANYLITLFATHITEYHIISWVQLHIVTVLLGKCNTALVKWPCGQGSHCMSHSLLRGLRELWIPGHSRKALRYLLLGHDIKRIHSFITVSNSWLK